jgi:hypothetical protein
VLIHLPLTGFIDNARLNTFATFANREADFVRLKDIDQLYRDLIGGLINARELVSNFLLLRTHSSYLAACRLTLSGQVVETFPALRASLESALYALFVSGDQSRQELWLRRKDNEATERDFRKTFTAGKVLRHIERLDPRIGQIARTLYDRTLDYGTHPNRDSILTVLQRIGRDDRIEFRLDYLVGDGMPLQHALRTSAQVGLCGLRILRNIYKERFDIMGLTERMRKTSVGL